ncbi:MAG: DUF6159 family protein [Actinomycetes bacterium]
MGRIRRTWYFGKVSWRVLRSEKSLAAFPVLMAVGGLVVFVVFGGLIAAAGIQDSDSGNALAPIGWVLLVVAYLVFGIVMTYFQVALCAGANERLEGRDTSLGGSMAAANRRLPAVFGWGILQGTVSVVLSSVEDRGIVGGIVAGLVGTAWKLATFLAAPVIALEGTGPIASLKRSGSLVRATWGENLFAQAGFGLFGLVASLPGIALIVIGATSGIWPLAVVGLVWILVVSVVVSAMTGILKTALYRYATGSGAPAGFTESELAGAFVPRAGRR